jgi:hypothetical protein
MVLEKHSWHLNCQPTVYSPSVPDIQKQSSNLQQRAQWTCYYQKKTWELEG